MTQATLIQKNKDQLHEAHMHVLVNLMQREVVMMHSQHDRIACLRYTPGYQPQHEIWKQDVRERLGHDVPPLLMYLEKQHYNALIRDVVLKPNVYEIDEEDECD